MTPTTASGKVPWRVLVAGSTFGQFYLAALATAPEEFEPVGLLARGSDRSADAARRAGVPLYTDVGAVGGDVDAACVAIRSGALGGAGTELATALLERGVHVLQEHPVHHDEVARCLRAATGSGVVYRLGDLYARLPAVRRFRVAAAELAVHTTVEHVAAGCSAQVLFPLLHVLGDALGGRLRPWSLEASPAGDGHAVLHGRIGGVSCALRVHLDLDPEHPDDHLRLPHELSLDTPAGRLTLTDLHGPLLWHPRLHLPDAVKERFDLRGPGTGHLDEPLTAALGPAAPECLRDILGRTWPHAIADDVRALYDQARGGRSDAPYLLALTRLWQDATTALGYPRMRPGQEHRPVPLRTLAAAVDR